MDKKVNRSHLTLCVNVLVWGLASVSLILGQASTAYGNYFVNTGQSLGASKSHSAALADVNNDGHLDAVVVNCTNEADTVWNNDGEGGFADSDQRLGEIWPEEYPGKYTSGQDAALGDLNDDGWPDAFVANCSGEPNTVWYNDTTGIFVDSTQRLGEILEYPGTYSSSQGVALGDLDGDGDLDAFVANANQNPNEVWLNTASARISGTVYQSDGKTPITGDPVTVNAFMGDPCGVHERLASVLTNPSTGVYQFGFLPPGTCYLQTDGRSAGYANEWWASSGSGADCSGAQGIVLGEGDNITGKNFQLGPSPVAVASGPKAISSTNGDETPVIALDGTGNAHIAWADGYYLYYKMVDRDGNVLIAQTNLNPCQATCSDSRHVRRPSMALDESGGLHMVFHGFSIRTGLGPDGYSGETSLSYSEIIYIKINPDLDDKNGSAADPDVITEIPERIISTEDSSKSRAANISCDKAANRFFVAWFDGPHQDLGLDTGGERKSCV